MEYFLTELPKIIDSNDVFIIEGTTHLVLSKQAQLTLHCLRE